MQADPFAHYEQYEDWIILKSIYWLAKGGDEKGVEYQLRALYPNADKAECKSIARRIVREHITN